ncbi:MAG: tRNA epoxyqueuosine(34) reductase QueG [Planctomycetota bacterium]|jgi:epoxyqueuosine reductase
MASESALDAELVLRRCREGGFALAGIAPAVPTDYEHELRAWLDAGRHGEMTYLARHAAERVDPRVMVEGARAIIVVADRYWAEGNEALRHEGTEGGTRGRVARYARGDDYHVVMKKRLHRLADELAAAHPDHTFRACVDTAPVLEREHAQRAGLGSIGKHTLLIERGVGSWLLLGEIITTLDLARSEPAAPDPCETCTRCIDACPTDAITPWSVDATRCISYLTIEHRSSIDVRYHAAIGDWIFGCDICQEVCPHNQPTDRAAAAVVHEAYVPRHDSFDLLEVLGWSADDRRAAFTRSALKRAKLDMMKRNAIIAAGNALRERDDAALRERLVELEDDAGESELVRETARAVLARRPPGGARG